MEALTSYDVSESHTVVTSPRSFALTSYPVCVSTQSYANGTSRCPSLYGNHISGRSSLARTRRSRTPTDEPQRSVPAHYMPVNRQPATMMHTHRKSCIRNRSPHRPSTLPEPIPSCRQLHAQPPSTTTSTSDNQPIQDANPPPLAHIAHQPAQRLARPQRGTNLGRTAAQSAVRAGIRARD